PSGARPRTSNTLGRRRVLAASEGFDARPGFATDGLAGRRRASTLPPCADAGRLDVSVSRYSRSDGKPAVPPSPVPSQPPAPGVVLRPASAGPVSGCSRAGLRLVPACSLIVVSLPPFDNTHSVERLGVTDKTG
ncbi:hypothetical protein ACHAWF_005518, partial [Thalassiosira exigua]